MSPEEQREQALGERLRRDYVNQRKDCPGKLVEIIVKREWERQMKERKEQARELVNIRTGILARDNENIKRLGT
jgi:hypothetical protein